MYSRWLHYFKYIPVLTYKNLNKICQKSCIQLGYSIVHIAWSYPLLGIIFQPHVFLFFCREVTSLSLHGMTPDWPQYHTCRLWNTYVFCYTFHLCVKQVRWHLLFLMAPFSCFLHAWKCFEIKHVLGWKEASCPLRQWIFCGTVKTVLQKGKFCWPVKKTRSSGRWNPNFSQRVLTQSIAAAANTVESTTA